MEKYNKISDKVSISIQKVFDIKPVYSKKYLKTKINSCKNETETDFYDNQIPKEDFHDKYFSIILINHVLERDENYYHQAFLEECKYIIKEKKLQRYIDILKLPLIVLMENRFKLNITTFLRANLWRYFFE